MISEIHQLRQDLQNSSAIVQRVNIAIYRLQAQATTLGRATQLLDQTRNQCKQQESQRKIVATQIEQAEARKQASQSPSDQQANEEMLSYLKAAAATSAAEGQQCQAQQIDSETRVQTEEAKMNDLQEQLEHLDRDLAEHSRK
jgi:predicted HTH domain antitoxin